jgi:hypothetical protein
MDLNRHKSGVISGSMNTAGLTGAYLSTVLFGYLANSYGYALPLILIGIIVIGGAFLWLKIDATEAV